MQYSYTYDVNIGLEVHHSISALCHVCVCVQYSQHKITNTVYYLLSGNVDMMQNWWLIGICEYMELCLINRSDTETLLTALSCIDSYIDSCIIILSYASILQSYGYVMLRTTTSYRRQPDAKLTI